MLGQIKWEQMMFLGNREYECDLTPIDFSLVAPTCGIGGWRVEASEDVASVVEEALAHPVAALIDAGTARGLIDDGGRKCFRAWRGTPE